VPRRMCQRHGKDQPCTCAMGNLYRFVEPVVLLLLKKKGHSYGYDLAGELQEHALTDAEIERGALYRTLRQLEMNGNVDSEWDTDKGGGPARRVYKLTPQGEQHLEEWATVVEHVSKSMARFVKETRETLRASDAPRKKSA
jgi:PadR family transcriptional regulator, regulatory protein PadR